MLVNQILLVSDVSRQHICPKNIGQLYVPRQGEHHSLFFNSQERAVCHCASRGRARRLTSDGIFANKIAITQYVEDCFLPDLGLNAEFYFFFLNDKEVVCRIVQSINCLFLREGHHLPTNADGCEKRVWVENMSLLVHWAVESFTRASLHWSIRTDNDDAQYCSQLLKYPDYTH